MQIYAERILVASLVTLFFTATLCAQKTVQLGSAAQDQAKAGKQEQAKSDKERRVDAASKSKKRDDALRAIMTRLEIGEGSTVADIGAGEGRDSWVFAEAVGTDGKVYAEEIAKDKVETLKKQAAERNLPQLHPVLGGNDDPALPAASVDMEFMHYVYHHFSQPREMLAGLWRSLKPGGYLVIVDRHLGTLQDWVPREKRSEKHYWIAETTVVREARETGFAYFGCLDDCWPEDDQFVLVFRRPLGKDEPGADPDAPLSLNLKETQTRILSVQSKFERPVFVALGQARELIGPIMKHATGPGVEVVLEEWATQKDERPKPPASASLPVVLTEKGKIPEDSETTDAVFFLDTYHLLFHAETLLAAIHDRLAPSGHVFVLDRTAEAGLSRREASHQRKIPVETVKQEMAAAGFRFVSQEPAPAKDRMFLVFRKAATTASKSAKGSGTGA